MSDQCGICYKGVDAGARDSESVTMYYAGKVYHCSGFFEASHKEPDYKIKKVWLLILLLALIALFSLGCSSLHWTDPPPEYTPISRAVILSDDEMKEKPDE